MIRVLTVLLLLTAAARAQTYLGDGAGTSGLGGSCCNWVAALDASGQSCPDDQLAQHPTCQVITSAQYQAYQTAALAPRTAQVQLNQAAATGVTLNCSVNPSYNGTYAITAELLTYLNGLRGVYVTNGTPWPPAGQAPTITDTAGNSHAIPSAAVLKALDNGITTYWNALQNQQQKLHGGGTITLPANTFTGC